MSAVPVSRSLLRRQARLPIRQHSLRHASTTEKAGQAVSDTSSKAKETASNVASKASQGLSRVTSSAGPALSGAARGVGNALSRVGGRTGRVIERVQSLVPPTVYYSKVGLELCKLVFQGRKMSPPNVQAFQSYFYPLAQYFRHPTLILKPSSNTGGMTPESVLNRLRNVTTTQLASGGVVFAEMLGFFTLGEMLGRLKLVGYHGAVHGHETAAPHE